MCVCVGGSMLRATPCNLSQAHASFLSLVTGAQRSCKPHYNVECNIAIHRPHHMGVGGGNRKVFSSKN